MKFEGRIGFHIGDEETKPGRYENIIEEKPYVGDVLRNIRRNENGQDQQNQNLRLNNQISIVSDLYISERWPTIKYVKWNGVYWGVTSVDVGQYPRVVLELGGVYHGKIAPVT